MNATKPIFIDCGKDELRRGLTKKGIATHGLKSLRTIILQLF